MPTEEKPKAVADLLDQAMRSFEQALRTGIKVQEESARLWTNLVNQTGASTDMQKKWKTLLDEWIPQTQKNMDEWVKIVEQNCGTSVELLRKALAASQVATLPEAQSKVLGFWEGSVNALRDGTVGMLQANGRAAESWIAYSRKACEASGLKF
jgi:hypothetical protein